MKKAKSENSAKILTAAISALMLISLISVFQAGIVSALDDPVLGVELQTKGSGTAMWTTEPAYSGNYSVHLTAPSVEKAGNEARIVIPMPEGTTLGDIETISWWVYTVTGYPSHIDIILADDIDGDVSNIDSLTAEVASNSNPDDLPWTHPTEPDLQSLCVYGTWLRTLEISDGIGVSEIDGATTFWVTRHGAGTADAPYGTLDELKAGTLHYPDREPNFEPEADRNKDPDITINGSVVVLRLEIEVDDWIVESEAYVDDITINGATYELEEALSGWHVYEGQSIQAAIDVALPGDTVLVGPGTYVEQIIIDKNLMLEGEEGAKIVAPDVLNSYTIAESGSTWEPIVFAYGGMEINGKVSGSETIAVDITGFEVDGMNKSPTGRFTGILYRNVEGEISGNVIENMHVGSSETFGIIVYGDSVVTISGNDVSGYGRGGIGANGDAGEMKDPTALIENNNVTGPGKDVLVEWASNGIQIGWGATGTIKNNTVTGNGWPGEGWTGTGILVAGSNNVEISNNTAYNNEVGIGTVGYKEYFRDTPAENNIIENNIVETNEYGISIEANSMNTTIENNWVRNNETTGIQVYGYDNLWGKETSVPAGTKIHYNNIVGNGKGVVSGVWEDGHPTGIAAEQVDATLNWWGTTVESEIKEMIFGLVTYTPWANTPYPDTVAPTILSGIYEDTDDDAIVDQVVLTFSEAINYTYEEGDWTVTANDLTSLDVIDCETATTSTTLTLTVTAQEELTGVSGGVEPLIQYNVQGTNDLVDTSDNPLADGSSVTLSDGAAPVIIDFEAQLGSWKATVKFSEGVYTVNYAFDTGVSGTANWTTEQTYAGSYSIKLSIVSASDWAEVSIPVDIALGDLNLDSTSFWCKSTSGDYIPYFIFELATGDRINNDAAASADYTDWAQYKASMSPQWQDQDGNWYSWSEILTTFGASTKITSVIICLSDWPSLTAYVDDLAINGATYGFEDIHYDSSLRIVATDFTYSGVTVDSVSHIAGGDLAVVVFNGQVTSTTTGTIAAKTDAIYDLAGNAAETDEEDMADERNALSLVDGWNLVSIPKLVDSGQFTGDIEIAYTYEYGHWSTLREEEEYFAILRIEGSNVYEIGNGGPIGYVEDDYIYIAGAEWPLFHIVGSDICIPETGEPVGYIEENIIYMYQPPVGIEPLNAYFVKANEPQEYIFEWTTDPQAMPPTKFLVEGWNLVGPNMDVAAVPTPDIILEVETVLDSVATTWGGLEGWSTVFCPGYNLASWACVSKLSVDGNVISYPECDMLPYEGYWVFMKGYAELAGRST